MTREMRAWRHGSANPTSPQNPTAPVDMAQALEMLAVRVGQLSPKGAVNKAYRALDNYTAVRLRRCFGNSHLPLEKIPRKTGHN